MSVKFSLLQSFLLAPVGFISTQRSTEELCQAAARRLSDFCSGIESSSSSETIPDSDMAEFNSKHYRNSDTKDMDSIVCESPQAQHCNNMKTDHYHCDSELDLSIDTETRNITTTITTFPTSPPNDAQLEQSQSGEAYLIPLAERPDVADTSLVYPPPPPPSPGDALADTHEGSRAVKMISTYAKLFDQDFSARIIDANKSFDFEKQDGGVRATLSETQRVVLEESLCLETNLSTQSSDSVGMSPKVFPNPFLNPLGRKKAQQFTSKDITTSNSSFKPKGQSFDHSSLSSHPSNKMRVGAS